MTDEMLDQFQLFFSDKNNVNMSSYKVDQKTGLPILKVLNESNRIEF